MKFSYVNEFPSSSSSLSNKRISVKWLTKLSEQREIDIQSILSNDNSIGVNNMRVNINLLGIECKQAKPISISDDQWVKEKKNVVLFLWTCHLGIAKSDRTNYQTAHSSG